MSSRTNGSRLSHRDTLKPISLAPAVAPRMAASKTMLINWSFLSQGASGSGHTRFSSVPQCHGLWGVKHPEMWGTKSDGRRIEPMRVGVKGRRLLLRRNYFR
jgi:hypothetical protein